jgi:hypothetical protein
VSQQPYTFTEAIEMSRRASQTMKDSEADRIAAAEELADAEREYRRALAMATLRIHAEGRPATVATELAKGDQLVCDLRYARDVKEGVLKTAEQRAWRHTADRKDGNSFIEWSRQRDMSEAHGEPQWTQRGAA